MSSMFAVGDLWSNQHDFQLVNGFARHTTWLHAPLVAYAEYGLVLFAVLLVAGWWLARRHSEPSAMAAALWAGLGTLAAFAANQPIVNIVAERRPYTVLPHVLVLVQRTADFSFPSDHAVMAGAVTAGLFLVDRRLAFVSTLAALLMAFSRVYVGAHYPADVLAGLALGSGIVLIGYLLLRRPLTRVITQLQHTPLRALVAASAATPVAGTDGAGSKRHAGGRG